MFITFIIKAHHSNTVKTSPPEGGRSASKERLPNSLTHSLAHSLIHSARLPLANHGELPSSASRW